MLSLESFSRLARRANMPESEHPMDIDPSREEALLEGAVPVKEDG